MHFRLTDAAERCELRDFFGVRHHVGHIAPSPARRPAPETEELARATFLATRLLALGDERLQHRSMDEDRPPTVDRLETVLEPMPDRVAVYVKELGNLGRFIAVRLLDPVDRIVATPLPRPAFPFEAHGRLTRAYERRCDPQSNGRSRPRPKRRNGSK